MAFGKLIVVFLATNFFCNCQQRTCLRIRPRPLRRHRVAMLIKQRNPDCQQQQIPAEPIPDMATTAISQLLQVMHQFRQQRELIQQLRAQKAAPAAVPRLPTGLPFIQHRTYKNWRRSRVSIFSAGAVTSMHTGAAAKPTSAEFSTLPLCTP
jgi:hypothetical protein